MTQDEPGKAKMPLNKIGCPDCGYIQDSADNKLRPKIGFGQMTCQRCRRSTKASRWTCDCAVEWHRCQMHVRKDILRRVSLRTDNLKRGIGSKLFVMGTNEPLPKRAKCEWNEMSISESSSRSVRITLEPGKCPKLSERFPHLVKRLATSTML